MCHVLIPQLHLHGNALEAKSLIKEHIRDLLLPWPAAAGVPVMPLPPPPPLPPCVHVAARSAGVSAEQTQTPQEQEQEQESLLARALLRTDSPLKDTLARLLLQGQAGQPSDASGTQKTSLQATVLLPGVL